MDVGNNPLEQRRLLLYQAKKMSRPGPFENLGALYSQCKDEELFTRREYNRAINLILFRIWVDPLSKPVNSDLK